MTAGANGFWPGLFNGARVVSGGAPKGQTSSSTKPDRKNTIGWRSLRIRRDRSLTASRQSSNPNPEKVPVSFFAATSGAAVKYANTAKVATTLSVLARANVVAANRIAGTTIATK